MLCSVNFRNWEEHLMLKNAGKCNLRSWLLGRLDQNRHWLNFSDIFTNKTHLCTDPWIAGIWPEKYVSSVYRTPKKLIRVICYKMTALYDISAFMNICSIVKDTIGNSQPDLFVFLTVVLFFATLNLLVHVQFALIFLSFL